MKNIGPATDHSLGGKGNVVIAKIADTCSGCDETRLDLSKGSWNVLTTYHGDSVVRIHWKNA